MQVSEISNHKFLAMYIAYSVVALVAFFRFSTFRMRILSGYLLGTFLGVMLMVYVDTEIAAIFALLIGLAVTARVSLYGRH